MSAEPRFNQNRKEWAGTADSLANQCYCEHFDVTPDDIYEVESLVDTVHDRSEGYETHQILDYGGLDRIIDCGNRHIHVSQRHRPKDPESNFEVDLSIRIDNGVDGREPELTKWVTAYESYGYYPDLIAFGRYNENADRFSEFFLLDTEAILEGVLADGVLGDEHKKKDGTEAKYISVAELRELDAIVAEWKDVTREQIVAVSGECEEAAPQEDAVKTDGHVEIRTDL